MQTLTITLLTDGSSDRVLLPLINFLLDEFSPTPHRVIFAEGLHTGSLVSRLESVLDLYPCDLLLIHRDAETLSIEARQDEIKSAALAVGGLPHSIHIIPVRMTETWLLIDQLAVRRAAGNPRGSQQLNIPAVKNLEGLPDPKVVLFNALTTAANLGARRRRQFRPESLRHRVAELIEDPSLLRALVSFKHFESQVVEYFAKRT